MYYTSGYEVIGSLYVTENKTIDSKQMWSLIVARLDLWTVTIVDLISYDLKFNRDDYSITQT